MKIINLTQKNVLAQNIILANTAFARMKGLLGKKELSAGEAMMIKPCTSIHTFFMRFAIDVLFVDRENRVVEVIAAMKPFRLSAIYFGADFVIELPSGTISATHTQKGDILTLE